MKLKNILTHFIVLYLVVACNSAANRNAAQDSAASSESVEMTSILSDDGCFEKKMEQWFAKFNQLQEEGYTMDEANRKAIASVALEFKTCDGDPAALSQQK